MSSVSVFVSPGGQWPLPWLTPTLQRAAASPAHALLLHAAPGQGALALGLCLAQAWLCEAPLAAHHACGQCAACRMLHARSHADFRVVMPEVSAIALGWKDAPDEGKKRPSKQIRIDDLRGLIDWAHVTSARGGAKVALVHQAESMNEVTSNALLKTLEEPPAGTRLVLTVAEPARLLPTVLSRCQRVDMPAVAADVAGHWLQAQDLAAADAGTLLAAASGQPLQALALRAAGVSAAAWLALPQHLRAGNAQALQGWALPQALDAMQKLCIDAQRVLVGAAPAYFSGAALWQAPPAFEAQALQDWWTTLGKIAPHADHPWLEALLLERLAQGAKQALRGTSGTKRHSGPLAPAAKLPS